MDIKNISQSLVKVPLFNSYSISSVTSFLKETEYQIKNYKKNEIILTVNSDIFDNSEEKKRILEKWYFENAKKVFLELLKKWMEILNEDVKKFSVKPLSKKWGFCNYTKRYVTLNVELIKRTPFEIEYVILHELAHLKYPNHGKGFYNYVEKYMPNYRNAEKMLNAKHHY